MHVYIITRIYAHMCLQDRCQSLIPLYFNFDALCLTEPGTHRLSTLVHQQAPEMSSTAGLQVHASVLSDCQEANLGTQTVY